MCGQGEWHAKKHGEKHRKSWTKLHIGVDDQGWIIASTVTDDHQQDLSQVPALLAQVDRQIERFIGDDIYDQEPVYAAVAGHSSGAKVIIPPPARMRCCVSRPRPHRPSGMTPRNEKPHLGCVLLIRLRELGRPQSSPVG